MTSIVIIFSIISCYMSFKVECNVWNESRAFLLCSSVAKKDVKLGSLTLAEAKKKE